MFFLVFVIEKLKSFIFGLFRPYFLNFSTGVVLNAISRIHFLAIILGGFMAIKVCDAIMGSGKSSAAISYMNEHPNQKFIYITPS